MPQSRPRQTVWLRDEGRRPSKPRLTRERIVEAAVELLDAEGVDGFSMRRLAARLGAGTMSLYEYVSAKEDVLDLALDAVLGEIPLDGARAGPWRAVLTELMSQGRQLMRRHPWIPGMVGTRPLLGPNALARSELAYTALRQAGLAGPALVASISAVFSYVHGFVAAENTWRSWLTKPGEEAELRRRAQAHLEEHADLYPTLSSEGRLVEDDDFDEGFALGLDIVLDGIEARLRS